jgi:hypothetical protein
VTRGWEDLPLNIIELRIDEELRRKRFSIISESSSAVSGQTSSPLKAPLLSGSVGSSSSDSGRKLHKKVHFDDINIPIYSMNMRSSPSPGRSAKLGHEGDNALTVDDNYAWFGWPDAGIGKPDTSPQTDDFSFVNIQNAWMWNRACCNEYIGFVADSYS